jgi:endoglucanase
MPSLIKTGFADMKHRLFFLITTILVFTGFSSCKKNGTPAEETFKGDPRFLHVSGTAIVDSNNQQVSLKGVAFGNETWSVDREIPLAHHTEIDYSRVKDMGMNTIRFYLNYKTLESDAAPYQYKQAGWNWIDQNIAWAKKYGIYLILNMQVPQGGFQSQGNGDLLWTNTENQNRLSALWKAIAEKYKEERQIIGFGLVNEPVPTASIDQWQQLAQRITADIRKADINHIIFVEKANYVKGQAETADLNFPSVKDHNRVYEFHMYEPFTFTHQLFSWAGLGEGGAYPDNGVISYVGATWYKTIPPNPTVNSGNSNWQYFEGQKYKVDDPKIKLAIPALYAFDVRGRVYFDSITIKEFNTSGAFTKIILQRKLNSTNNWGFYSKNNSGRSGLSVTTGVGEPKSIYIEGTTDDCNLSNYSEVFVPQQGYTYQVNGWMKGENVAATAKCMFRIDFLTTNTPLFARDKAYLGAVVKQHTDWARTKSVPVYLGEFGSGIYTFYNNKGGIQWASDMIDICKAANLPFTYYAYHEDDFGIYYGQAELPTPANANLTLIDLFKQKLK